MLAAALVSVRTDCDVSGRIWSEIGSVFDALLLLLAGLENENFLACCFVRDHVRVKSDFFRLFETVTAGFVDLDILSIEEAGVF